MPKPWFTYEEVATHLLDKFAHEFGLARVEGKQSVKGQRSQTTWTIDAKGVTECGEAFVIVECRRYTTKLQEQEKVGALAYRIIDTGAAGGIVVSPLGLQTGAEKVACAERIVSVQLNEDSTPREFSMRFFSKLFEGVHEPASATDEFSAALLRLCSACGMQFPVTVNETECPACSEGA
jgi:hypothetical protein